MVTVIATMEGRLVKVLSFPAFHPHLDIRNLISCVFQEKVDRSLRIYQGWPEDQVLHTS